MVSQVKSKNISSYIKQYLTPSRIFFYDFETERGLEGSVIYAYFVETDINYNEINNYEFFSIEEVIQFIKKNRGIYIAHNSGGFDFLKMMFAFKEDIYNKLSILKNGKFLRVVLKGENAGRIFQDSLAVIPMALRKFKNAFNLDVGKSSFTGINYIISYQMDNERWEKLKKYCKLDVYVLIEGYKKFEEMLVSKFKMKKKLYLYPTLSSISFNVLQENAGTKFKRTEIAREVYSGGRTEIFKFYGKDLKYIDINSSYPYVMANFSYPTGKYRKSNNLQEDGIGFGRIVSSPDLYIPPSFVKSKLGSKRKLLFTNFNEGDVVFSTNIELRYMEKIGYKIDYLGGITTEENSKPFTYLKDFYEERKKTEDKSLKIVIKLLMNSAYGKFGQKQIINVFSPFSVGKRKINLFSNTIIASYITARARIHLYDGMRKCGLKNVYYTDTDSIIAKRVDEDMIGNSLGKWKLEHKVQDYFAIQPKVYFIRTKDNSIHTKAKGFGQISAESYDDFLEQLERGMMRSSMVGVNTIIKENMGETFFGTRRIKKLISGYEKRKIINNFETRAFYNQELQKEGHIFENILSGNSNKIPIILSAIEKEIGKSLK